MYITLDTPVAVAVLHVERHGRPDGPSLVLVHGFSDSGRCWPRVISALAADYHIVTVDARDRFEAYIAAVKDALHAMPAAAA